MTNKVMKLVEINTGKMKCEVCGYEHYAMIKPDSNGSFYRGSYQCPNGCKTEEIKRKPLTSEDMIELKKYIKKT